MKPNTIYAVLATGVAGFFLGWLLFGILLSSYYQSQSIAYEGLMKDPPELWALVAMNLAWASLLVIIFRRWAKISSFKQGFPAGMIIFFPIMAGFDLSMYGFMNLMSFQSIVVDIIANTIFGGIMGGIAGLVLGMGKKGD